MMFRNNGGPWRRASGVVVPHTGCFEPTARELQRMQTRRQVPTRFSIDPDTVVHPAIPVAAPAAEAPVVAAEEATVAVAEETAAWPMRMTPELYLRMYPKGKHAALAARIV
jgi:hypothetical protein